MTTVDYRDEVTLVTACSPLFAIMEWTELLDQLDGQIKQKLTALDKLQASMSVPAARPGDK